MKQKNLFNSEFVPAKEGSGRLFDEELTALPQEHVTCLGMKFADDAARRAHFTELLRAQLLDPEFRSIEGFPIGSDEDILNLSDPPYYTACPNPWTADFIEEWEREKKTADLGALPRTPQGSEAPLTPYHREPFAADVSEGKNDPIYNAHSYHTKVPHRAVMRYILHYTEPGDIVFDGFCGTGMTGVAAQMCGDRATVESLGYKVDDDGVILQRAESEPGGNSKDRWLPFSKLGARRAVLNDLSPAATFIAYNYNTPVDVAAFEREARRILKEVEDECGWMYETKHPLTGNTGKINYTVWSDVFICQECTKEVVFWEAAVNKDAGKVLDEFPCPHCGALLTKRRMERAWVSRFDSAINETVRQAKQIPVLINYTAGGKRAEKTPDDEDLALIEKIESSDIPYWFPTDRMMLGQETRRNDPIGITHVHHFYTKRNLFVFSAFLARCPIWLKWTVTGSIQRGSKQHQIAITRIGGSKASEGGATAGHRRGTLYIPSNQIEVNALGLISDRLNAIKKNYFAKKNKGDVIITTTSITKTDLRSGVYDYFFFDPPFGENIAYSELNSLQESWHGVSTNQIHEAIVNKTQKKNISDYHSLMRDCFNSAYNALKPGRWMTIEFSNTSAKIWNIIQTALLEAGFIVANVSILDKKRGGLNAIIGNTAVKQDLVISAYKPNGGFEERFEKKAESEEGVWEFVATHLKYLPVTKSGAGAAESDSDSGSAGALIFVPERDPRILFDQMVAYYVRKGRFVPLSSQEFQTGLAQRFIERDGMYFLPEQAAAYDRKRIILGRARQMSVFVSDESSAIQWLRGIVREKPQTFSDINPLFMKELGGWSKNEVLLDLKELLHQNFLCHDGKEPIPAQILAWMMKSSSLREIIDRELSGGAAEKDASGALRTANAELLAKAENLWYVPDPNRAADLEKLRDKTLLKEFESYIPTEAEGASARRKLKVFRMEAVRAGFKKAWQERSYSVIVAVAERIPTGILEEDPKLLMWYDQAVTRLGG